MRDFKQTLKKVGGAALFLAILALLLGVLSRGVTDLVTKNDDLVPARNKSTVKIRQEAGQTIDVLIVGDSSVLEDLTSEDLVGTIDLSQYSISKGRYSVAVKIYVQGKVLAWAVGEYSADIEVTPKEPAS